LVHLITTSLLLQQIALTHSELRQVRIVTLNVDPEQSVVLHVRAGFVSSVRVPDEVNSVVLGDPGDVKVEQSEAELRLVFFKTTRAKTQENTPSGNNKGFTRTADIAS
jgi:hypothetical protein